MNLSAGDYYLLADPENWLETNLTFVVNGPPPIAEIGFSCDNPIEIYCSQIQQSHSIGQILNTQETLFFEWSWDYSVSEVFDCETAYRNGQFWFKYMPEVSEEISIGTIDSLTNFDSRVSIFTGECGNMNCVISSDTSLVIGYNALTTFNADIGETYYIGVSGNSMGDGEQFFYVGCTKCMRVYRPIGM
jgi:hypothetical protein